VKIITNVHDNMSVTVRNKNTKFTSVSLELSFNTYKKLREEPTASAFLTL
jgi:hypothetical protein